MVRGGAAVLSSRRSERGEGPLLPGERAVFRAEARERLNRIQRLKGVEGYVVVNSEGEILETTMEYAAAVQYAGLMSNLATMTRSALRDIDPRNDLTLLLMRSKRREITAAPGKRK
ncbi:UNVERIFIED_CONTAM: hypothetical protein H355_016825 [Colinus virginianus]|nr:hypothetical protein H355_016825 [Colinus virginianus]